MNSTHVRRSLRHPDRPYVLVDAAFVPGLHKKLANDRKAILFASLPGCTEEAVDASPFVTLLDPADRALKALLLRCDRWPMLSVIATPESLQQLASRLSAWCVVEVDGQRFNFRFPDTRRLPAIFDTLSLTQRAQLLGPAKSWMARRVSYGYCVCRMEKCLSFLATFTGAEKIRRSAAEIA